MGSFPPPPRLRRGSRGGVPGRGLRLCADVQSVIREYEALTCCIQCGVGMPCGVRSAITTSIDCCCHQVQYVEPELIFSPAPSERGMSSWGGQRPSAFAHQMGWSVGSSGVPAMGSRVRLSMRELAAEEEACGMYVSNADGGDGRVSPL